ncbi:hypothetical protein ACERK3_12990 [Phycisphaerales bacterium AB-hyl4]|uniref:Glucosamine-6-phosphate deaminase n=1 Tax=Natronomicrosphaera hydrolytica TaxID=3242702 RepID=A0ABV4U8Y9_9BACT
MSEFVFAPSHHVPFRDKEAIERCRRITRDQIEQHANPDYRIKVIPNAEVPWIGVTDMLGRIKRSAEEGRRLVMILPNPNPGYRHVARLINALQLDCRNVWGFAMDEYADEDGRIAPDTWKYGFVHSLKSGFWGNIDPALRPPEKQFLGPTDENIDSYGKMIEDLGGADVIYLGPGWTGHLAFIEPDAPEFDAPLDEWKQMGTRIVTLSPYTLAQNSLHGSFGMSGDLAAVPPKAATIGPAEVIAARHRISRHAITVHGTHTSWQRMITRLVTHGPVTPRLPESLLQTLRSDIYISETAAANIEPDFEKGY